MTAFGTHLRRIRNRCVDPDDQGRRLTQGRLGELLGRKLEIRGGFSGAAVSDWERGKSKIHADDRLVLISLLAVLYDQGGIENLTEANQLLESGYYRSLDQSEAKQIFPPGHGVPIAPSKPEDQHNAMALLLRDMFFIPEELQTVLIKAKEGPLPAWPHIFAALLRAVTDRWSVNRVLQALWWIWIWLITWGTITPSLRWPFISQEQAKTVIVLYMGVTLFFPLLIGLFTNTRNNEFWTILMAWQFRRTNTTVIPIYWWLFIFGVLAICQSIVWFIQ